MKKLTSLAISLILSLSAVSSMTVLAETEEAVPRYTYLELMEMSDEQISDAVEEIFDALEPGGLLYAKFREEAQIGKYINDNFKVF